METIRHDIHRVHFLLQTIGTKEYKRRYLADLCFLKGCALLFSITLCAIYLRSFVKHSLLQIY